MPHLTLGLKKLVHTFLAPFLVDNDKHRMGDSWRTDEKETFAFEPLGYGCNST